MIEETIKFINLIKTDEEKFTFIMHFLDYFNKEHMLLEKKRKKYLNMSEKLPIRGYAELIFYNTYIDNSANFLAEYIRQVNKELFKIDKNVIEKQLNV